MPRFLLTDTSKGLRMVDINDPATVDYAILSHRWGDNEALYGDLTSIGLKYGRRFDKVRKCCRRARKDGYKYVWIDTCCIDQKSSAELSESINSMFSLYAMSAVCYAFLRSVPSTDNPEAPFSAFRRDEWFDRGWTLQELIAPQKVVFLDEAWGTIGEKGDLARTIQEITRIDFRVLCGLARIEDMSIAERMSWASRRSTTKVEDRAYSLLGIFGVHMTTIYGEGENAFQRLQYKIISRFNDHSIFAWYPESCDWSLNTSDALVLLAPSPSAFSQSAGIVAIPHVRFAKSWDFKGRVADVQKTTTGLRLELPLATLHGHPDICIIVIACEEAQTLSPFSQQPFTIGLVMRLDSDGHYRRIKNVGFIDADRFFMSGHPFDIKKIDTVGDIGHILTNAIRPSNLELICGGCQLVLKAAMLKRLRDVHNIVLDDKHTKAQTRSVRDWHEVEYIPAYEQSVCRWMQKNFVMTVPSMGNTLDEDVIHSFVLHWTWSTQPFVLEIYIDARNSFACRGYVLRESERVGIFPDGRQFGTIHRWSKQWGSNGETVNVTLTQTSVKAEMVSYGLELDISKGLLSRSDEDATQLEQSETNEQVKSPVRWVLTCVGIIPKDAYMQINPRDDPFYFFRAYRKGTAKPGILARGDAYSQTFSSYEDFGYYAYEYEVLIGSPSLRWVPVRGKFRLKALKGAKPVEAGREVDGQSLYLVRALKGDNIEGIKVIKHEEENGHINEDNVDDASDEEKEGVKKFGVVRVGHFPRLTGFHRVTSARRYAVLVYSN